VDLQFLLAYGATVTYYECVGDRAFSLGERSKANGVLTSFYGATQWRCGRLDRHFAATATLADGRFVRGTAGVRTMSCAHRFELDVPRRLAPGQQARVRVIDRWGIGGIHTRLCTTSPVGRRDCRGVAFPAAASVATRRFRPATRGGWRVELQVRQYRIGGSVAVGVKGVAPKAPPPTVLARGDSTMDGVESFLADDLGDHASIVSDVIPGFAISSAEGWAAIAASQAARVRPIATVISIGANEGFPMKAADGTTHGCCDDVWVEEYARRVHTLMLIYRRHGLGRVFYLTIAAPREAARAPVIDAVNTAIVRAGAGLAGVRVLRMDLLFSPHGYQDVIRYRGRDVPVREPDGVHLNISGTAIEAREVAKALRRR
jgi:lysophospholipase L1-like esterase